MNRISLFDHRPDPVLGRALREALSSHHDAEFVKRVMAAARIAAGPATETWSDVLSRWAVPGVAAAMLIATVATISMGGPRGETEAAAGALEDTLRRSGEAVAPLVFLASNRPPNLDAVLANGLEIEP